MVHARIDVPSNLIGLAPPPVEVRLRVSRADGSCGLILSGHQARPLDVLGWLAEQTSFELVTDPSQGGQALVVECSDLPEPLAGLCERFSSHVILLSPDGTAKLALEGPRSVVRALTEELQTGHAQADLAKVTEISAEARGIGPLTDRQNVALRRAKQEGYYDIPRRIQLKELAEQLSMSPAALSELLRRAEARLIDSYLAASSPATSEAEVNQASLNVLNQRAKALDDLL